MIVLFPRCNDNGARIVAEQQAIAQAMRLVWCNNDIWRNLPQASKDEWLAYAKRFEAALESLGYMVVKKGLDT